MKITANMLAALRGATKLDGRIYAHSNTLKALARHGLATRGHRSSSYATINDAGRKAAANDPR